MKPNPPDNVPPAQIQEDQNDHPQIFVKQFDYSPFRQVHKSLLKSKLKSVFICTSEKKGNMLKPFCTLLNFSIFNVQKRQLINGTLQNPPPSSSYQRLSQVGFTVQTLLFTWIMFKWHIYKVFRIRIQFCILNSLKYWAIAVNFTTSIQIRCNVN